jgi:hypothetical protein
MGKQQGFCSPLLGTEGVTTLKHSRYLLGKRMMSSSYRYLKVGELYSEINSLNLTYRLFDLFRSILEMIEF